MDVQKLDRVLLATDGSTQAAVAADLVKAIRWPAGTTIEVISVYEPFAADMELPPDALIALDRELREEIDVELAKTRARVLHADGTVDTAMRRGPPDGSAWKSVMLQGAPYATAPNISRSSIGSDRRTAPSDENHRSLPLVTVESP